MARVEKKSRLRLTIFHFIVAILTLLFGNNLCYAQAWDSKSDSSYVIISAGSSNRSDSFGMGISFVKNKIIDWNFGMHFGNDGIYSDDWNEIFAISFAPGYVKRVGKFDLSLFAGPAYVFYLDNAILADHVFGRGNNLRMRRSLGLIIQPQIDYEIMSELGLGVLLDATLSSNANQLFVRGFLNLGGRH